MDKPPPPITVRQLDALALRVRQRAAKYLNAVELVKELVEADAEGQGDPPPDERHPENQPGGWTVWREKPEKTD